MASFYTRQSGQSFHRAIFVWPWKMVSANVRHLFYQPVDEKIKTWTLCFSVKENPNMEKALFDWPILLQYDVKAKYRFISSSRASSFSPERPLNQPKATRFTIRSINQSNRFNSVRLLFLFRSSVFISRSYENRSIALKGWNRKNFHRLTFHERKYLLFVDREHHYAFYLTWPFFGLSNAQECYPMSLPFSFDKQSHVTRIVNVWRQISCLPVSIVFVAFTFTPYNNLIENLP